MSGQRSADDEGTMAGGCSMREGPPERSRVTMQQQHSCSNATGSQLHHSDAGLAVFTWGRGEDGQLGLGDTADQDEPTYVRRRNN